MNLGLTVAMVTIVAVSLTGLIVFANEKRGPKWRHPIGWEGRSRNADSR